MPETKDVKTLGMGVVGVEKQEKFFDSESSAEPKPILKVSKREIDEKANQIVESRKLPPIPGKAPTFQDFESWQKLLSKEMLDHLHAYIYRLFPAIIRQQSDPENNNNIDCRPLPISKDEILNDHGGGEYDIWIKDSDIDRTIMKVRLKESIQTYEPKLDYREIDLGKRDNIGYINKLKAEGKLDKDGKIAMTPTQQQSGDVTSLARDMVSTVRSMGKEQQDMLMKLLASQQNSKPSDDTNGFKDIFLEKLKQEDPNKQMQMIVTLITAMKSTDKTGDENLKTVVSMMQENSRTNMEMMKLMMQSVQDGLKSLGESIKTVSIQNQTNNGNKLDGLDGLEKLLRVQEKLKESIGVGNSTSNDETLGEKILGVFEKVAPPILGIFGNIMQLKTKEAMNMPNANANGNTNGNKPPVQSGSIIGQGSMMGNANGTTEPVKPTPVTPMQQLTSQNNVIPITEEKLIPVIEKTELEQLSEGLMQYGGLILAALNGGKQGWEFAAEVSSLFGVGAIAPILKFSTNDLLTAMKANQEFWIQANVFGEENVKQWIEEFKNFREIIKKMEEEEENEE